MQNQSWLLGICGRTANAALALAIMLVLAVFATGSAQAQTFTTLYSFEGAAGAQPYAGLVQGTDGRFYGTTQGGGAQRKGTAFKITSSGGLTRLLSFDGTDGEIPQSGLLQATDGNLYGTAESGGTNSNGTVFKITSSGNLTTLYNFCSQSGCTDGGTPTARLVQATDGNFYGTTFGGGTDNGCLPGYGCGTVFEITSSGTLTTLHSFDSTDGANPFAGLVQATDGNLYGTTEGGGANSNGGTVFKITPSGKLATLYSFCSQSGCTDGISPIAGLVQATDGNLYGTTEGGGASGGGTVFKITPSGKLTTVYNFCSQSGCTDGDTPTAGLVQATDGNFYGTTFAGGASNGGTVFKITPSGKLTTLYNFCSQSGCPDGGAPFAGLLQATDGTLYGTTLYGGAKDRGTFFSLSVGLGPFVETLPTSGEMGTNVIILGTSLTRGNSVTFNGTAATFTVVSRSEITTTVPTGATTGPVQVVTPDGTLTSNVNFRVTP